MPQGMLSVKYAAQKDAYSLPRGNVGLWGDGELECEAMVRWSADAVGNGG